MDSRPKNKRSFCSLILLIALQSLLFGPSIYADTVEGPSNQLLIQEPLPFPPVVSATDKKWLDILALLKAKAKANVNVKDKYGYTPLMIASLHGDIRIVEELLAAGADVNAKNKNGWTALLLTVYQNDTVYSLGIIKTLLSAGSEVNVIPEAIPVIHNESPTTYGFKQTALMIASMNGQVDTVETLLEANADPNAGECWTALDNAIHGDSDSNVIEREKIVHELISAGAEVNRKSNCGRTILMLAASSELSVKALLDAGASVNDKNNGEYSEGETALMDAIFNIDNLRALLAAGANVNLQDKKGNTALMLATHTYNSLDVILSLLAADADVNAKNASGDTALIQAVCQGIGDDEINAEKVVKTLISSGAKINEKNHQGETALDRATECGYNNTAPLLRAAGAVHGSASSK